MPVQAALARFIDDGGFARHVRKLASVYRARHERIARAIASDFGEHLETVPSSVGLHIAALSRRQSIEQIDAVIRRAAARGIGIHPLSRYAVRRPLAGLLIAYGAIPTSLLDDGLRKLRECFEGLAFKSSRAAQSARPPSVRT
jgi:GntR family transcriptional regulator/MocR family aminotransferase